MKRLAAIFAFSAALVAGAAVVEQFSPAPGAEFKASAGGSLRHAQVFSGVSGGTAKLERILAVNVYTNAVVINTATQTTFTVEWSNTVHHVVTTNIYNSTSVTAPVWCVPISSNTVETVTAATNSWPVLKEIVTAKETIFSGTLTGNQYTNSPAGMYIIPGERLIFSGTSATNGWLRLVLE